MAIFIQNREELEQRLVIMKTQEGWSIRALARHFAVSRNLVRRILRKHEQRRDQGHDILLKDRPVRQTERASKLDAYQETIQRLLEKYPRITGQRLFEELRDAGYDGGISILRDRLRRLRPRPKKTPVIRFETEAWTSRTDGLEPLHHQVPEDRQSHRPVFLLHPRLLPAAFYRLHPEAGFFHPDPPPPGGLLAFYGHAGPVSLRQ